MFDHDGPSVLESAISRREALKRTTLGAIALATGACLGATDTGSGGGNGRLSARVAAPAGTTAPGIYPLGLASGRDGLLYIPTSYDANTPAPLALLLHGAGRNSSELMTPMRPLADTSGLVLVAPDARGVTWDAIGGAFLDDVTFIDRALTSVFARVRVDATRVRIMGFSVGGQATGKSKVFITHGTRDTVLPIDQTSRQIVPRLKSAGYDVEYHEFDGGHGVTPDLLAQAATWVSA